MKDVSKLEGKHLLTILVYVKRNRECLKTDLYKAVSHNPRMPDKLDSLEREGLLCQERRDPRGTTTLSLTEKGERVATLLEDIDCVMRS